MFFCLVGLWFLQGFSIWYFIFEWCCFVYSDSDFCRGFTIWYFIFDWCCFVWSNSDFCKVSEFGILCSTGVVLSGRILIFAGVLQFGIYVWLVFVFLWSDSDFCYAQFGILCLLVLVNLSVLCLEHVSLSFVFYIYLYTDYYFTCNAISKSCKTKFAFHIWNVFYDLGLNL